MCSVSDNRAIQRVDDEQTLRLRACALELVHKVLVLYRGRETSNYFTAKNDIQKKYFHNI